MNYQTLNRATTAALGVIIAGGIFAVVTVGIKLTLPMTAINADRAAVRTKALAELRAEEEKSLNYPAVIDAKRGIVRLPIKTALALAAQKYSDPAAARADLKSRVEKATAPVKTESFE